MVAVSLCVTVCHSGCVRAYVCACVRECVRACVRACVCVCVCVLFELEVILVQRLSLPLFITETKATMFYVIMLNMGVLTVLNKMTD